jgi:hypothetical protein
VRILITANTDSTNEMTESSIEAETGMAVEMFSLSLGEISHAQNILNVLSICSTQYANNVLVCVTDAKHYFYKCCNIDEVIVLDLTS